MTLLIGHKPGLLRGRGRVKGTLGSQCELGRDDRSMLWFETVPKVHMCRAGPLADMLLESRGTLRALTSSSNSVHREGGRLPLEVTTTEGGAW